MPTTQADVTALRQRNGQVVTLAKRALAQFWESLDLSKPEQARDALLAFMPVLVEQFGQAAATVAADWYETVRAKDVTGLFDALLADGAPAGQVEANVRYQAGHLFTDDPGVMLATLQGTLQRHVVNRSRATVRFNASRDNARPRYARVPTGRKTCVFCSTMASLGFVFASKATAGDLGGRYNDFHDFCDCEVIVNFSEDPRLEGYDPDALYSAYQSARGAVKSGNLGEILAEMRRQDPDRYTDGVDAHQH